MTALVPFHLAFEVQDLQATRSFFESTLGCKVGRESSRWIDFDFFGHQITAHLSEGSAAVAHNAVDGDQVPVRHFGAILPWGEWQALGERLRDEGIAFLIEPKIRFRDEPGEQGTFFVTDPSGNALEFKSFKDPARLFAR